jgi:2-oxoglutarate ferredoxin oxidoreductase subunit gamma
MTNKLFFAGAGGQGVLLMGQMTAYAAMAEDKPVTFLPSYGPEMRGGTSNCTVVVSDDKPVSCPVIYEADAVVVMNLPSLIKFESLVKPGGKLFINSSLVDRKPERDDIDVIYVPTHEISEELGNSKAANIVMLGALLRTINIVKPESCDYVLKKIFSGRKEKYLELNQKAFTAFKI